MAQSPETCQRYGRSCEQAGCYLLHLLRNQAASGGSTPEGKPAGPVWPSSAWHALVERVVDDANDAADPCPIGQEVAALALRLTLEKAENGTLQSSP